MPCTTSWVFRIPLNAIALIAVIGFSVGCKPTRVQPVAFEPNYVRAYGFQISEGLSDVPLKDQQLPPMDQVLADAQSLLEPWFGTPDEPALPEVFKEEDYQGLLSLDRLRMAAGVPPEGTEPSDHGLYRQLCASCHGVTGQGRGPVSASQNPYPRDFRLGLFKFKSTPANAKPLRADIERTVRQGLPGSQMPNFQKLSASQVDALVDYVIYLSVRGELERKMIQMGVELDLENGERLYNPDDADKVKDQTEAIVEELARILDGWMRAGKQAETFAPAEGIPVPGFTTPIDPGQMAESIAQGKKLFLGEIAACYKCHGESARGDGKQAPDYDEWTKDWTVKFKLKPTDTESLLPLMARGALQPQPLLPRNLVEGKLRGGSEPLDIYRRIRFGIPGTPMPAASLAAAPGGVGLTDADIWHLVNYVRSLP